jgi:hypothetical protein
VSSFHRYVVTRWGVERSWQALQTNRAYARGICEGIAVRAGELSLCTERICMPSTHGAYALVLLAIGALSESVSLSGKTKPGEVLPQKRVNNTNQ